MSEVKVHVAAIKSPLGLGVITEKVVLKEDYDKLQAKLKIAIEALKTIHLGIDPRNGEWSEEWQDTMLKAFTAKTASDYANEILEKLEEK